MASTDLAAFDVVSSWPVERVAVGAIDRNGDLHLFGDRGTFRIASVSKQFTVTAALISGKKYVVPGGGYSVSPSS